MPLNDMEFTSQWAILPARVRYDPNITPNAKLIYAEIAAKTNSAGYCWASNSWFAERFGMKPDTVSKLISVLEAAGYISVDVDLARVNAERRRIYLSAVAFVGGLGYLSETPYRINIRDGIGQISETPTIYENNNLKEPHTSCSQKVKPKYMAMDVFNAIGKWCGEDAELMMAWLNYAEMRQRIRRPIATAETVQRSCRKLDKLSEGSRAYKLGVLRKATDNSWQGLFPLKPGDDGSDDADDRPNGEELPTWT